MDYFELLIAVNKVSIFFFIITVLFVAYEFYLFRKERAQQRDIPQKLPNLDGSKPVITKSPPLKAFSEKVRPASKKT